MYRREVGKMVTLNAGCGCDSWGDVRLDIEKTSSLYDAPTTANILASIEFLPFRDKVFKEVRCYHTLEHVDNPFKCLRELLRVGEKVDVKVPSHNFYCIFLYDILSLPLGVVYTLKEKSLKPLLNCLYNIRRWGRRVKAHKWYVRLKNATVHKWLFVIPLEYQKIYG